MTEARRGDPLPANPEDAYLNDHVVRVLTNSGWFIPSFIEDVQANEPEPERPGLGEFVDKRLGGFFLKEMELGKGNEAFLGVRGYVAQRIIGPQGHPYRLGEIPFTDDEVRGYARDLGVDDSWEFDRGMLYRITDGLLSIIAPEDLRRKVVSVTCSWGAEDVRRDVLLLSQLVRKGAKQFIEQRWSDKPSNG